MEELLKQLIDSEYVSTLLSNQKDLTSALAVMRSKLEELRREELNPMKAEKLQQLLDNVIPVKGEVYALLMFFEYIIKHDNGKH